MKNKSTDWERYQLKGKVKSLEEWQYYTTENSEDKREDKCILFNERGFIIESTKGSYTCFSYDREGNLKEAKKY